MPNVATQRNRDARVFFITGESIPVRPIRCGDATRLAGDRAKGGVAICISVVLVDAIDNLDRCTPFFRHKQRERLRSAASISLKIVYRAGDRLLMETGNSFGWLDIPAWLSDARCDPRSSVSERMALVISLAHRNVRERTGGPFAAAIFETESGRVVAAGVNRVVPTHCSHAHAEMIAIAIAEQQFGTHDLGRNDLPELQLVSSCEPCAMCIGAICWSGLSSLVCAAREKDVRAIGFDEGPKSKDWVLELQHRGIQVTQDVQRADAQNVIADYVKGMGEIYSPERLRPTRG